uniref:Uncharacterized protein n=1 Tax=Lactuca sativa TaxID=4236 RepID=A0A9R1WAU3_LACSA|nr:hypothetical protein LSAT_V11C300124490 [Lactuca sativa]
MEKVLDTWADLLNHQELGMNVRNSLYGLFLKVEVSNAYVSSTLSDQRKYEKFKNFHETLMVVRSVHIFVIVFNLKKPSIEITDNSVVEGDYEGKYGVLLKHLKILFVRNFEEINHPRANAISKYPNELKYHGKQLKIKLIEKFLR